MRLLAPMPSQPKLVIAAIAASAYAKLAVKAGFKVVVIDAFADTDTQNLTTDWHQISLNDQSLSLIELLSILDRLDLSGCVGFCYGAGFEQHPQMLEEVAKRMPVLGNTAKCIANLKNPQHFFEVCEALSIPYPMVSYETDIPFKHGLTKKIGGSGGAHIQQAIQANKILPETHYCQELKQGLSLSCLFLAHVNGVEVLGFNQQWTSPTVNAPYRFGGLVSHIEISEAVKAAITQYVAQLSQAYGLVGLNTCDVICQGEQVWVLEINPRLSASVAMYDECWMQAHVAVCNKLQVYLPKANVEIRSRAFEVLYADKDLQVPMQVDWPEWVADIPPSGIQLYQGAPLLTIHADAEDAELAKTLLAQRVQIISKTLKQW
jgi:uncharacterized protein